MSTRRTIAPERLLVVSPHFDDAALSLGATIARAVELGSAVTVLTVFGGDPDSDLPAGEWDRRCGFATAGASARARRGEEERASELLGATPVWLRFADEQYAGERDERAVCDALAPAFADADLVLIPGAPLVNDDHAWLTRTILRHLPDAPIGLYVEQPYASDVAIGRGRSLRPFAAAARIAVATRAGRVVRDRPSERIADLAPAGLAWIGLHPTRRERALKDQAIRAHSSQCDALGKQVLVRIRLHEGVAGGERIALRT